MRITGNNEARARAEAFQALCSRLAPLVPFLAIVLLVFAGLSRGAALDVEWTLVTNNAGGPRGAVQLDSGEILATRDVLRNGERRAVCFRSVDNGRTWEEISTIARQKGHATVGDGHLFQLPSGDVLFSYRHNRLGETPADKREYSIRIAVSRDGGEAWEGHSTVATSSHDPVEEPQALRGLWSSFLFLAEDGKLHCVYDDEDTPHREGFSRHQWLTMRTWDETAREWLNPVTVSRAHHPEHLSRDGMPSVVRLPSGRLLCAFETVQVEPPHANLVRYTTSDDGGKTWSWKREPRGLLFEPENPAHLAMSPWLIRLKTGELLCLFSTDEDRDKPGVSGRPPHEYFMDIKFVSSENDGRTWSRPAVTVFGETHRNYMPGIVELRDGSLLVTFVDYAKGPYRALHGAR